MNVITKKKFNWMCIGLFFVCGMIRFQTITIDQEF
jgi:phosphatidylserine synthase